MKSLFLALLIVWMAMATRVPAAYYRVATASDNTSAVTTAGHAGTAADPFLAPSLRSAVLAANNNPGADVILFDAVLNGTSLTLSLVGNDDAALVGDLDVTGPLTLAAGGTLIAHWSSGQPLVGSKDIGVGRTVGVNFYPPSSDVCLGGWQAGSDGGRLMANALLWAGKAPPTIVLGPSSPSVVSGGVATFSVTAVGTPPLTYQWARNGTNLPGGTNAILTVPLGSASAGRYLVAVTNPYGAAFSPVVTLTPLLRLLSPSAAAGGLHTLLVATVDNSPLTVGDLNHIHLYATTNVATASATWTLVANPPVLTNGLLRVDGLPTNAPDLFYRALSTP